MADALFDIKQLEEFSVELEKAAREAPRKHKYMLRKAGDKLLSNTASIAPDGFFVPNRRMSQAYINYKSQGDIKTSLMKQFIYKGKPQWVLKVEGDKVTAGTKVFYAKWVNDGHKIVVKHVSAEGKVTYETVGFVPGTHFMDEGLEKTKDDLPEIVEQHLKKVLEAAFK